MALAGADILIYPTAIGWDPRDPQDEKERQRDAWITIQRSHAIANGLPLISVNRTGFEPAPDNGPGSQFWGSSFVAGPQGEILAEASTDKKEVLIAEIDFCASEHVRRIWPFLRDRRIDAFDGLTKRFLD
jgi:N-carbamoylputrescine amidase